MPVQFRSDNSLTRRRFLQAGAALGLATPLALLRAETEAKDGFGEFTVGAQSYCFREFNTEQALKRTSDLGLHFVEFYNKHAPTNSTPEQIQALLRLCDQYKIKPVAFGVERFTKDHDANKRLFEFGKTLGIKAFSADPEPDSFDSLDKLCDEFKIAIAIHPHGPAGKKLHRWYSAQEIMKAVKNHHPLIGSCLDTGHLIRAAQPPFNKHLDPAEQVRIMSDRNFGMHLKDHDNQRRTDVIYGKGVLDVLSVLKALREVKFKGHISIEYEANPQNPSPDMKACLEILQGAIKARPR
ncbi:MAG: sugar phosphate isomerase/epimerase [Planctomycetes bacterium]|nr:sugar phosphate isomerase/epimerase [Planctomycetota bacterium]